MRVSMCRENMRLEIVERPRFIAATEHAIKVIKMGQLGHFCLAQNGIKAFGKSIQLRFNAFKQIRFKH